MRGGRGRRRGSVLHGDRRGRRQRRVVQRVRVLRQVVVVRRGHVGGGGRRGVVHVSRVQVRRRRRRRRRGVLRRTRCHVVRHARVRRVPVVLHHHGASLFFSSLPFFLISPSSLRCTGSLLPVSSPGEGGHVRQLPAVISGAFGRSVEEDLAFGALFLPLPLLLLLVVSVAGGGDVVVRPLHLTSLFPSFLPSLGDSQCCCVHAQLNLRMRILLLLLLRSTP